MESLLLKFQHTAARRRLILQKCLPVISHSFNTQPPEGDWQIAKRQDIQVVCFNTQPPEGDCAFSSALEEIGGLFQHTAARRRLAWFVYGALEEICFNTQPPEGDCSPTN